MTSKTVAAVMLTATICLAFALPAAHAGGGMGSPSDGVTTCRLIASGAPNQPQSIAIADAFTTDDLTAPPSGDVVKINAAVLVCDLPATGRTVSGPATVPPVLPGGLPNSITCYAVAGAQPAKFSATIHDTFTAVSSLSGQSVVLGAIQLVCVPAVTE